MTSLFMPFDLNYFFLSFFFLFIGTFFFFNIFYKINFLVSQLNTSLSALTNFFLTLKPKMFNKISGSLLISIFMVMMISNFLSVFSFIFPITSQVSTIMIISMVFWLSFIVFSLVKNMKSFVSHLIPEGCPLPLTILLFLIELVSNIIRPLTLMIRLVANILAGHLLMSLLSSLVFVFPASFIFYLGLNMVELMVALIQAYIFTTMTVLYYSEV